MVCILVLNFEKLIFFYFTRIYSNYNEHGECQPLYSTRNDTPHPIRNPHLEPCSFARHTDLTDRDAGDPEDLPAADIRYLLLQNRYPGSDCRDSTHSPASRAGIHLSGILLRMPHIPCTVVFSGFERGSSMQQVT